MISPMQKVAVRILAFMLLSVQACTNRNDEINAVFGIGRNQEDKAEEVVIILSRRGKVEGRLFAREFIRNELAKPPYTDMKKGLRLEVYDDSLNIKSVLTARYARYYEEAGNILVRDSIVVRNQKGERLQTEELVWNQKLEKFYTDKFVKITTASQVILGEGMEANQDFSWYQIKNITGTLQVDKSDVPVD